MKLISYWDLCDAMIPIIADMMGSGQSEAAIKILKAMSEIPEVDLARAVKEYCKSIRNDTCEGCQYKQKDRGCIFVDPDHIPEEWE